MNARFLSSVLWYVAYWAAVVIPGGVTTRVFGRGAGLTVALVCFVLVVLFHVLTADGEEEEGGDV